MENASKALLIAGAILIVILLIGVGMMVFRGANDSITGAMDTMNSQEIKAFNSQFASYEGKMKGTSVKALLQSVIASNAGNTYNRTVKVTVSASGGNEVACASKSDGTTISKSAASLKSTKTYKVSFKYDEATNSTNKGCINEVVIENG